MMNPPRIGTLTALLRRQSPLARASSNCRLRRSKSRLEPRSRIVFRDERGDEAFRSWWYEALQRREHAPPEGYSHTNLIFDAQVPFDLPLTDREAALVLLRRAVEWLRKAWLNVRKQRAA